MCIRDSNGILWIGTHGGGIIISDRRWDIIKRYQQNCDNETNSIITDSSDRIYLATYHKGIMRSTKSFCPSDSTLQFVTIPIPQLEPTYFCAVRDKNGLLWFGNKNGRLLCYNTSNDTYTIHPLKKMCIRDSHYAQTTCFRNILLTVFLFDIRIIR